MRHWFQLFCRHRPSLRKQTIGRTIFCGWPYSFCCRKNSGHDAVLFVLCLLLAACAPSEAIEEQVFLPDIEGIPIYEGFAVNEEKRSYYDSPEGKVVEVVIEGRGDKEAISAFYAETLPELGWEPQKEGGFKRDDEVLDLEITEEKDDIEVKFSLQPAEN